MKNLLIETHRYALYLDGGFLVLYDKMVTYTKIVFMPEACRIFNLAYSDKIFQEYLNQ
jgi:hypothetical protein